MKKLFTLIAICLLTTQFVSSQSLLVKANGTVNALAEFETTFFTAGIGVEGGIGDLFSVGMDAGFGGDEKLNIMHFSPTFKFYPFESLTGIYVGVGATLYSMKSKNGTPIGFPLDSGEGSKGIVGGPEAFIGFQALIEDSVSLGFQTGVGAFPDIEALFINVNFTVGIKL